MVLSALFFMGGGREVARLSVTRQINHQANCPRTVDVSQIYAFLRLFRSPNRQDSQVATSDSAFP